MTSERAIQFDCAGDALVGIVHLPGARAELGVVVVVGGPQVRVGAHRQFVQLARALASAGYAVLRFDVRGMGDSEGAPRGFEHIGDDIAAAIDALLANAPAVRRVALWGLCDGASAALLYVDSTHDSRVVGVVALNPWVRSELGLARTQVRHYYLKRVLSTAFWSKLLRGGIGPSALQELARKLALAVRRGAGSDDRVGQGFADRMARGCEGLEPGRLLVVLSGNDYTAREFSDLIDRSPLWQRALKSTAAEPCEIAGADHTLSQPAARQAVEAQTLRWLSGLCPLAHPSTQAATELD